MEISALTIQWESSYWVMHGERAAAPSTVARGPVPRDLSRAPESGGHPPSGPRPTVSGTFFHRV